MKKWALIGAGLMLLAWSPWLYAELTSAPAEKKVRELSSDEPSAEAPAVPAAEQPKAEPEQPNEPEQPAAPEPTAADKLVAAAQVPDKPAAAEPAQPGAPDPAAEPSDDVAEEEEVPAPVAEGPTEVLKQAFDTQPRDALWAKDAEARIAGLFGTADVPAEMLQTATCRKAVCRVEVRWTRERAPAFVSVYQAAKLSFGSAAGILPVGTLDDDGHQQVDLYLSRKGYTVADLLK